MTCLRGRRWRALAHVEVFAERRVLLLPAGIGVSRAFRCSYEVRTVKRTGVVEFDAAKHPTVGQLFTLWGQPLSVARLAGFSGGVRAYVGGRTWRGDVRAIPLTRHAQITLEVGGFVRPHAFFLFPTTGA
jgi:hypothetical protein